MKRYKRSRARKSAENMVQTWKAGSADKMPAVRSARLAKHGPTHFCASSVDCELRKNRKNLLSVGVERDPPSRLASGRVETAPQSGARRHNRIGRAGSPLPAGPFQVYGLRRVPHMRDAPYRLSAPLGRDWRAAILAAVPARWVERVRAFFDNKGRAP